MRFTLRELVLVTAIVGLALGWWLDRRKIALERDVAIHEYQRLHSSYRNLDWTALRRMVYPSEAPAIDNARDDRP